jgi:hypothetical protein
MTANRQAITVCAIAVTVFSVGMLFFAHRQASTDIQLLTRALTSQYEGHKGKIQYLVNTMPTNDRTAIEDAVYEELQGIPSTSLIRRSDIKVTTVSNRVECSIDTSRFASNPPSIVRETKPTEAAQ